LYFEARLERLEAPDNQRRLADLSEPLHRRRKVGRPACFGSLDFWPLLCAS
jgi:hypothetical protein